jgi:hypothetical protein
MTVAMVTAQLVDSVAAPIGTGSNPLAVTTEAVNREAATFTTTNTAGIGQASVLVSAAYPGGKRSVVNDGPVLLRIVNAAGVAAGGFALPVGAAYVIDGQNPLSAPLYAYAPTGTGSVSEIRQ